MTDEVLVDPSFESDPRAVRRRECELLAGIAPIARLRTIAGLTLIISPGAGLLAGLLTQQAWVTPAIAIALAAGMLFGTLLPLESRIFRAAAELYFDHDRRALAEWKSATGTRTPRTLKAVEASLAAHPGGMRGASLLVTLGRLPEAEATIATLQPATPEEALDVALLSGRVALLVGKPVDFGSLHRAWSALPESAERDHLREDLALIEARSATAHRQDPVRVLAAANPEISRIYGRMRIPRMLADWAINLALVILIATVLVWSLV